MLYEMGLPIVETGDKWHINVGQKIPLNRDRNNVTPAYLRSVRTLVVNEMNERLTTEDANELWVRRATSDPACSKEATWRVMNLRFGEKRAAYDPTDPESNKNWVAQGGTRCAGLQIDGMIVAAEPLPRPARPGLPLLADRKPLAGRRFRLLGTLGEHLDQRVGASGFPGRLAFGLKVGGLLRALHQFAPRGLRLARQRAAGRPHRVVLHVKEVRRVMRAQTRFGLGDEGLRRIAGHLADGHWQRGQLRGGTLLPSLGIAARLVLFDEDEV